MRNKTCEAASFVGALIVLGVAFMIGCTDTEKASFSAYGRPAKIECFSGPLKFYAGESTGRIHTVSQSDGWEFKEKGTGDFIRVSGACLIRSHEQ